MNEIRHQAMIDLQKLVLAAENRMIDLVAVERTKMTGNRTTSAVASLQISPSLISQYNVSLAATAEVWLRIHSISVEIYYIHFYSKSASFWVKAQACLSREVKCKGAVIVSAKLNRYKFLLSIPTNLLLPI